MRSSLLTAATIIPLLAGFVNAARSIDRRIAGVTDTVMRQGDPQTLTEGRAKALGLDGPRQERVLELMAEDRASDGFDHGFEVVLDSTSTHVDSILLQVGKMTSDTHSESYYFNLTPGGALERITLVSAEYADGKAIRGSGHYDLIPSGDRTANKKLQHELDFWLKGKYRKKKPASK